MNRVVTGFNATGKPVIVRRGEPPTVIHAGRYVTTELWVTDRTPPAAAGYDTSTDDAAADPDAADPDTEHTGFQEAHATDTLDYVTVISGQVILVVGEEEITLGPGDSVIQQPGVPHDWQNRSAGRAMMVGVLLSAR
jgi:hypothetical protein